MPRCSGQPIRAALRSIANLDRRDLGVFRLPGSQGLENVLQDG